MKIGLVTYTPEKVEGFDLHVYYSKRADGSIFPAAREMQNDVTCFCDAKAIREDPSIVAVSNSGSALRKNRKINVPFDFVCPTNSEYRANVLDYVEGLRGNFEPLPFSRRGILCLPQMRGAVAAEWLELDGVAITGNNRFP